MRILMPTPPDHRHARQVALLELVRQRSISRQDELAAALTAYGFEVTQSSVSRDLRELGVVKVRGRYVAPAVPATIAEATSSGPTAPGSFAASTFRGSTAPAIEGLLDTLHFVRDLRVAGPHLTLVITATGAAQTVALALDRCGWPEVVGTVAGDDTILVATAGAREQGVLLQHLEGLRASLPSAAHAPANGSIASSGVSG
jgi:transcriptional regulator of arginine metabolism